MATVHVQLPLPVLPEGWSAEKDFKAIGTLSTATQRNIEPVGPHFLAHARRKRHHRTFSEDDRIQAQENVKKVEDDDAGEISEPEDQMMLQRDAKDWKGQDHYAVLGLSRHRWRATESQIKTAHRKKVLRHHPDKRAATGSSEDDSFFKCIQKATEVLLDPVKRRQFDSVDENADVEPPRKRMRRRGAGNDASTKEEVEAFYNFWYNFDSWRSFEYQDEDVPDDNENRDQKRHIEKKNNNARKKKKTEDTARLRSLVDDCLAGDERIKKFRQQERAGKNRKREEKEEAERREKEEKAKKKEEDERLKKVAEEAAKAEKAEGKKAKEAAKNAAKKNKRVLKSSVKDVNYLLPAGETAGAKRVDEVLNEVDLVMGKIDNEELAALAGKLGGAKGVDAVANVWAEEVKRLLGAGKIKDGEVKTLV
ncbi:cell wall acid trehalase [Physcia stellaris]|nr:cell wall acid trehalase [Physcia stellaris]